jgi:hypothetical protein
MESQNGYPVIDSLEDCKYYDINIESTVRVPLSPGVEGEAIALFLKRFDKYVEKLNRTDTHGYNKRKVANSTDWSNHASGTAADCNATKHVQGRTGTFTDDQVKTIRKIQDDFDGIIKWGGDYRVTKDEMHFEIIKPVDQVELLVRVLKRYGNVRLSRIQPNKRNLDVYMVKRKLLKKGYESGTLNFYYGVGLTRALKRYQADHDLPVTAKADAETLKHLGLKPE